MATELPGDWDVNDPHSWVLGTTVDAHMGYHGPTGMVMREYRDIVYRAVDFGALDNWTVEYDFSQVGSDGRLVLTTGADPKDEAEWWYDVLSAMLDSAAAVAEASPERIERAMVALGIDPDAPEATIWSHVEGTDGDLETDAERRREIVAALDAARVAA